MKKDELHELIKSLSSNEKRYFKLFAKQHGEDASPKYLELFDVNDSMEEYDSAMLDRMIEDKRILKFLNQEKKYLKDKIMDSLRVYRGGKSIDSNLYRIMEDQAILYEKGLFSQCQRQLQRAKKLAQTYDRFSMLVEVLSIERKLTIELRPQELALQLESIDRQQKEALELQSNLLEYQKIWRALLAHYRHEGYRNQERLPLLALNADITILLTNIGYALSFAARHLFRLSTSLISRLQGDFIHASGQYEELLEMWKVRPDRIKEDTVQYNLVIANYLNMQHKLGRYEHFPARLEEMKELQADAFADRAEAFQNLAHLELLYYLNVQLLDDPSAYHRQLEQKIEEGLMTFGEKINSARRLVLFHNMMVAKFFMEDWVGANKWRLRIEQDEDAKHSRREILDFTKIMQIILQFELEDYDWLQSLYRNHKRSLERGDRLSDFFSCLLDGIHKLASITDVHKRKAAMMDLELDIREVVARNGERNILGASEVLHWLKWKLNLRGRLKDQLRKPD
jgi:hypothetical protein